MLCPGSNSQTYPAVITRTILCTNLLQKLWLKFYHKNWLDTLRKNVEALLQPQVNLKVKAVIKYLLLPGMGGRTDPTLQMNRRVSKLKWETTFENSYFRINWKVRFNIFLSSKVTFAECMCKEWKIKNRKFFDFFFSFSSLAMLNKLSNSYKDF